MSWIHCNMCFAGKEQTSVDFYCISCKGTHISCKNCLHRSMAKNLGKCPLCFEECGLEKIGPNMVPQAARFFEDFDRQIEILQKTVKFQGQHMARYEAHQYERRLKRQKFKLCMHRLCLQMKEERAAIVKKQEYYKQHSKVIENIRERKHLYQLAVAKQRKLYVRIFSRPSNWKMESSPHIKFHSSEMNHNRSFPLTKSDETHPSIHNRSLPTSDLFNQSSHQNSDFFSC